MSHEKDVDDLPINLNLVELKEQLAQRGIVICPVQGCNQDFKSLWGLKYHLKRANHQEVAERKFKCEQCNLLFQSRVNLRQHRIDDHSGSEGESPMSSPSASPRSREHNSFQFASANTTNQETTQVKTENSCTEASEHSVTYKARTGQNEEIGTPGTGVIKKKRGRLRKNADQSAQVDKNEISHLPSNGQVEVSSEGVPPSKNSDGCVVDNTSSENTEKSSNEARTSQNGEICTLGTGVMKKKGGRPRKNADHSPKVDKNENSHLTSNGQGKVPNNVTPRRTSTRVRTPRKDIYVYNDAEIEVQSEDENETSASSKSIPKKRGRKPKNASAENVNGDSVESSTCGKTLEKKRGKKRKRETVVIDDENDDVKKDNTENDVDDEDDDVEDDNDDEKMPDVTSKKRGRKKKVLAESTRLKRLVESGHKLTCGNKGCRAKFTTAMGYIAHQKICGLKEEEREKFACEICGRVYMSFPGVQYHMKTNHIESEPAESSDHPEDEDKKDDEPEILPSGRTRRKAASRAISKVQRLTKTEQKPEEVAQTKRKAFKKVVLEQLIAKIKGRSVTKELEDRWTEALKTESNIVCPSKGCSGKFQSVASIKAHLESDCEKAFSYKCLACGNVYVSPALVHNHVRYRHVGYKPTGKDKSDSSDVDYKVVSSGESEEDEDDVEIEEIEESGSDLNEELEDCMEEIFVWDDLRKKFKKSGRPIASRRNGSTPSIGQFRFTDIGTKDSEDYRMTERWRKKEYKHEVLFPTLRPSAAYWSRVDPSEIDQYLPEGTTSPKFIVRRKGDNQDSEHDNQLPLFGSTSKEESSVNGDVTFNVGGPVWAMDWCPVPDSSNKADQFLAISTHRSWDEINKVHKCVSSKGLIQLWSVGQLNVDSASSGSTPTLALGIAHDYGAIWDISWCPSGTWEPESTKTNQEDGLPRLGVMAVACGDGLVRILSIPWPSALLSALNMTDSDNHSSSYPSVIVSPTPHLVLMPCALGVAYNGECGQAWRAKWFPCSMHEKIATGFSDGTVAIWNLLTESPLLKEKVAGETQTFRLSPFLHIATNSSVVKDLAWSPQYPDYLVTGSYDRNYKLWNLKSPFAPVIVMKRGIPHEVHWPVCFKTIVSCEDDSFQTQRYPCVARYFTFVTNSEDRQTTLAATHNSTIWTVSISDWTKLLATADAGGEVVGVQLTRKRRMAFQQFGIYRVYLEDLDIDRSQPSKEQEPNEAKESQDISNSELLEERQIETCTDKVIELCTSESMESSAKKEVDSSSSMEIDASASKEVETCTDKEKENATPPPQSTAEVFEKQRLVFYDVNALEFQNTISNSDADFKRLANPSTMQTVPYDNFINPQAIHKVRFNPNKQAFTWLASGGAAGLARLHLVKQVTT